MSSASKEEKPEGKDLLADLQDVSDSERKTSTGESSMGNRYGWMDITYTFSNQQTWPLYNEDVVIGGEATIISTSDDSQEDSLTYVTHHSFELYKKE